jgi:outer membrane murein-binding lipoprotein Lpp
MNHKGRDPSNSMLLVALVLAACLASGCQMDGASEDSSACAAFVATLGEFAVSFARQLLAAWVL